MSKKLTDAEKDKRAKRLSIAVSIEVFDAIRALATLNGKSINDYVFECLSRDVAKNQAAVQKVLEAQQIYIAD